jgi:purine nucleosidase
VHNQKNVFIDTDVGDDVDDSFAIAFAANSPELNLTGISTVFRDVSKRASLAHALLEAYGITDVPVYEGCGKPLIKTADIHAIPCQYDEKALSAFSPYQKRETHGVLALLDAIRRTPDLTIIAIGPLTNIALATVLDPDLMRNASIYMMGGAFSTTEAEWNIFCDPEAAQIVFNSGADIHVLSLDVTAKCKVPEEKLSGIRQSKTRGSRLLASCIQKWETSSGFGVTFHDPMTIAGLIRPDLVCFKEKKVAVELHGEETRAATVLKESLFGTSEVPNAKIATSVQEQAVIDFVLGRIAGK